MGLLLMAPTGLAWIFIPPGRADLAYHIMPFTSFIGGVGGGAIGVAFTTLVYRLTVTETRAVQFATYGVFVTLAGAPMPFIGGWLVHGLQGAGFSVDLRLTFYVWIVFVALSAWIAKSVREPGSMSTRKLVFCCFPQWINGLFGSSPAVPPSDVPGGDDGTRND